jgi:DnaJ homolog subfamily C member 17
MAPKEDEVKLYAEHDFYALLDVTFETSESNLRRAYRKKALISHPDKNPDDSEADNKFQLVKIAYDVLSEPALRAAYDVARAKENNAREARLANEKRNERFDMKRKEMRVDLEERERGSKRMRTEEADAEERKMRELQRLAEDGARRRREREEALRKKDVENEEKIAAVKTEPVEQTPLGVGSQITEHDRTVRVTWPREGLGEALGKERLEEQFSIFGDIDYVLILKDKKVKIKKNGISQRKLIMGTGMVCFKSIVGTHAAVEDGSKTGPEWDVIESVSYLGGKEPEVISGKDLSSPSGTNPSPPSTPVPKKASRPFPDLGTSFPGINANLFSESKMGGLRKVPSFASFSSANINSPKSSPVGEGAPGTPSLEESTLIRLKKAEKKRLEDQLRKEDEEAAQSEVA